MIVAGAGLLITAVVLGNREEARTLTINESSAVPADWHYDAVLNRHWDPGHAHWHDGPPPTGIAGGTPAPWHFDAVNNRHWDPTAGHNHWHEGPPPPLAQRSGS